MSTDKTDAVNHPAHYTGHPSGVECVDVTEHFNFCRGNAIKYVWRAGAKGDELEDLRKARWYLDREIERLTEPSVNVTETPDLSTEDAGTSSEPAPGMTRCDTCGTERPLGAICSVCDPAPADVNPDEAGGEGGPEPKVELDEVEALARDLFHASLKIPPVKEIGPTTWLSWREHEMWLGVARAAREHIEDSLKVYYRDLYDKAEADLARVTRERDEQTRDAIEWRNRYDALREDGVLAKAILHSLDFLPSSLLGEAVTAAVTDVLTAADRAAKGVQS